MIDLTKLRGKIHSDIVDEMSSVAIKFQITTPERAAHFLGQAAHESTGFTRTTENLNYSAVRLLQIFPKYFDGGNAEEYARNPQRIASRVYANRMGNGDEASGDGWKYRGRGYIQLTGHDNYYAFDQIVTDDVLKDPGLVATRYPLLSAGWFWNSRGLNGLADQGIGAGVIREVTKKVNGGTHGLDDRIARTEYFYEILRDDTD